MFIINVSIDSPSPLSYRSATYTFLPSSSRGLWRIVGESATVYLLSFLLQSIPETPPPQSSPLTLAHPRRSRGSTDTQAPYLFSTVWSLIKPWLDEATVRKIHILGRNYKSELQQYIAPENLPVDLGGKCRCERDGGCSLSNAGPWTTPAPAAA